VDELSKATERFSLFPLPAACTLTYAAPTCNCIDEPEQESCAKECRDKRPDDTITIEPEETQDSTSNKTANDADDNVSKDTQLITLNQAIGKCASETADNDPHNPCP
jgi:hypothetical protein